MRLFLKAEDFVAFERIIEKTLESCPMRICAYGLMPKHWHLVLWPERNGDRAAFLALPEPRGWRLLVQAPQTESELEAIRRSVLRGQPYRRAGWVQRTARSLGLETTLRPRG